MSAPSNITQAVFSADSARRVVKVLDNWAQTLNERINRNTLTEGADEEAAQNLSGFILSESTQSIFNSLHADAKRINNLTDHETLRVSNFHVQAVSPIFEEVMAFQREEAARARPAAVMNM